MYPTIKLSARAQEIIKDALDAIEREPQRWNQGNWVAHTEEGCGTTACLGGWIVARQQYEGNVTQLPRDDRNGYSIEREALRILGLKGADADCFSARIFYMTTVATEKGPEDRRTLRGNVADLKRLKERIAAVTGMEL